MKILSTENNLSINKVVAISLVMAVSNSNRKVNRSEQNLSLKMSLVNKKDDKHSLFSSHIWTNQATNFYTIKMMFTFFRRINELKL